MTTRHRFRVNKRESKVGDIYPLSDETLAIWTHGHVLGTAMAELDMPGSMPKSEAEAWSWLPTDVEIAPPDTRLSKIEFIYKEGNKDWTTWFVVEPEKVRGVLDRVHWNKQGWVEFETFSRQIMLINLSEVTRVVVREDW